MDGMAANAVPSIFSQLTYTLKNVQKTLKKVKKGVDISERL